MDCAHDNVVAMSRNDSKTGQMFKVILYCHDCHKYSEANLALIGRKWRNVEDAPG